MPRTPQEYAILAQAIPNLTRSLTGLVQQGLTSRAAGRAAQAPTQMEALQQFQAATPFPGATDIQQPVAQQALAQVGMREQATEEAEKQRMQEAVLQGGLETYKKWYNDLVSDPQLAKIKGRFVPPENIKGREDLKSAYEVNSNILRLFSSEVIARQRPAAGAAGSVTLSPSKARERINRGWRDHLARKFPAEWEQVGSYTDIFGTVKPNWKLVRGKESKKWIDNKQAYAQFAFDFLPEDALILQRAGTLKKPARSVALPKGVETPDETGIPVPPVSAAAESQAAALTAPPSREQTAKGLGIDIQNLPPGVTLADIDTAARAGLGVPKVGQQVQAPTTLEEALQQRISTQTQAQTQQPGQMKRYATVEEVRLALQRGEIGRGETVLVAGVPRKFKGQ